MSGSQTAIMELQRLARRKVEEAKEKEAAGDLKNAAALLRDVAGVIRNMAEREIVQADRVRRYKKAAEAGEMAAKLDRGIRVFGAESERGETSVPASSEYKASVDELIYRSSVTWEDIAGMEEVKASLKYTLGLLMARMPRGVRLDTASRILLYGPPGTGKTLLAAACSNMLDATFFNVKASNLLSKWFGESTQLVSALFARARSVADTGVSVVFIDEFDGLCRARGDSGETGAERRILSTLLAELEGLTEKGEASRVITIAATNKPWDIDEAILERFKRHIYVGLPDKRAREEIFRIHVERKGLSLKGITFEQLAERTEGYSGRLIERTCQYAIDRMVQEANPLVPRHVEAGKIGDYEIAVRPLTREHFEHALEKVQPTTTREATERFRKYQARIGGEQA